MVWSWLGPVVRVGVAGFVLGCSGNACPVLDPVDSGGEKACPFGDPEDTRRKERKINRNVIFCIFDFVLFAVSIAVREDFEHILREQKGIVYNMSVTI